MKTVFVRVVEAEDKGQAIRGALDTWKSDGQAEGVYEADTQSFGKVPGSPFAYWAPEAIRNLFADADQVQDFAGGASLGASTKDDFRYLRLWHEVEAGAEAWVPYAKGGEYAPFYGTLPLVIKWKNDAREIGFDVVAKYPYLKGNPEWVLHLENPYFSPGLTWSRRSQLGFSLRVLPADVVFGDKGPAVACGGDADTRYWLLGIGNSRVFLGLLAVQMAFGSFEVGVVNRTILPPRSGAGARALQRLARQCVGARRVLFRNLQQTLEFVNPALCRAQGTALGEAWREWWAEERGARERLEAWVRELDQVTEAEYGLTPQETAALLHSADSEAEDGADFDGARRWESVAAPNIRTAFQELLEWTVGVTFGRFDIRLATGKRPIPEDPDPFDPLPVCSPGMLQNEDGLPATSSPSGYPIEVAWDGILVDDEGHPRDIVRHIRRVLSEVSDGQDWAAEAEEMLGRDLRSWVQRSLFEDHIKRYSKSRRKAPIFWRLGTPSGSYSVWLYYPRATGDTLYRVLNDYVEPKLRHEESALLRLRQEAGASPTASQQKRIEAQEALVSEVQDMKGELEVLAQLWRPEFDDGVVLNFAPFWRLVAHTRKWQKECQKHLKKLREGEYDWSYTAMRLWPERVVPACAEDRSFAIAHGLEKEFFPEEAEGDGDGTSKVRENERIRELVDARSSAAVKQALQTLLER